jgi:hypothetical protein
MFHSLGFARFSEIIPKAAAAQLRCSRWCSRWGLVENAMTLAVNEAIPARVDGSPREGNLLVQAKSIMGKL